MRVAWLARGRSPWACRQASLPTQNSVACPLVGALFHTALACSHLALTCGERCKARQHAVAVHTFCRARSATASCLSVAVVSRIWCTSACQQTQSAGYTSPALDLSLQRRPWCHSQLPRHPCLFRTSLFCMAAMIPTQSLVHQCTPADQDLSAHFPCPVLAGPPAQAVAKLHLPLRGSQSGLPPGVRAVHSNCTSRWWLEKGLCSLGGSTT